jgi:hypothetical protein
VVDVGSLDREEKVVEGGMNACTTQQQQAKLSMASARRRGVLLVNEGMVEQW